MKILAVGVIFICWAAAASADVLAWQDANGVRHYTNMKAEVPKEQQEAVQVIVDEVARHPAVEAAAAPAAEQPATEQPVERPRQAQVVYDRSDAARAYVEGLERGLELGRSVNTGGNVNISGPLAVAGATERAPSYGYLNPAYYPLVTTSFDRGRSRHLTLRMLLEDQFNLDQEGPYVYLPPLARAPLGVDLNPFLPRGLPHGFPQNLRVITR